MTPEESRAANAAVRYALTGVPILPLFDVTEGRCTCYQPACRRPGKHPRIRGGVHDATTDPDTIRTWWSRWPSANVGAATGAVFDVWDLDLPEHLASPLVARILTPGVPWPMVRTGSGGTHVFTAPTGQGNRTRFKPGCDWRGQGGYVVLPPSMHASGHPYHWVSPLTGRPPTAPPVLLAALQPPMRRATGGRPWRTSNQSGYAAVALARECDQLASMPPDSGRNEQLNRAAFNLGQLVGGGLLTEATVIDALTAAAARCHLGQRETDRTITSGLTAGQRNPRTRRGHS